MRPPSRSRDRDGVRVTPDKERETVIPAIPASRNPLPSPSTLARGGC